MKDASTSPISGRTLGLVLSLTVILVVAFSLLPQSHPLNRAIPPAVANIGHMPAYALLFIGTAGVLRRNCRSVLASLLAAAALCVLLGGALEWLQSLSGRAGSAMDMIWNLLGIAGGAVAWKAALDQRILE